MVFLPILLVFVITCLFLITVISRRRPEKFPPGPHGWPLFGNLLQVSPLDRHKTFSKWGEKYGDIIGIHFGPNRVVVLNNHKHIREAFNENVFSGRPLVPSVKDRNKGGKRGVIFNEGQSWIEQRRFCLKNLRDLGLGKKSMQGQILEEVNDLISRLGKTAGTPISTTARFNVAVLNSLWNICCGDRFNQDDPVLLDLMRRFSSSLQKPSLLAVLSSIFPLVQKLRKALSAFYPNPGLEFIQKTYALIEASISQHKATFDENAAPRDFIDLYLKQIKDADPQSSFYKEEGELGLPVVLLDLFTAGAETTSTTLIWTCLLLSLHPEVQEKLHKKIVESVGTSRQVTLEDRPNIPYIEAVIQEVLRFSALIPLGVAHKTMDDCEFHGYKLPKGTTIMPNLYHVSRDKSAWGDPENFRPERFLSDDEKTLLRHDALIPFAIGKRVCPGESLARDSLTLFVGNIFQRFKWSTVPGENPTIETESIGVLVPKAHNLIVTDRFS